MPHRLGPNGNSFVKEKVRAVLAVVSEGFDVLFCDLDMVWKRPALGSLLAGRPRRPVTPLAIRGLEGIAFVIFNHEKAEWI